MRLGAVRSNAPGPPVMHPDAERVVLHGETAHWGTSSRAVAEHRAMIQLAGGLPAGWQRIAAEAEERRRRATE